MGKSRPATTNNIRNRIQEVAANAYISATEEFCDRVEEEIQKTITPEFLEKVRISLIKAPKPPGKPEMGKAPDPTKAAIPPVKKPDLNG